MQHYLPEMLHLVIERALSILVSSCATNTITPYSKLDKSEKTITVPAGGGANAVLKTALKNNGWSLKIDSSSLKTEGTGGSSVHQKTTVESDTRYRMLTSFTGDRRCATCGCVRSYNISIVDNKSGEEVVAFDGHDEANLCYETISTRVINWLNSQ
jgi:hypothetical protein